MKIFDITKKLFLSLYFLIQCVFSVISYAMASIAGALVCRHILALVINGELLSLFSDFLTYEFINLILCFVFYAYFVFTVVSMIATYKFMQNKPLTLFDKISSVAFPFITIPSSIIILIGLLDLFKGAI